MSKLDLVLLDLWFSPFAARVRIALAEKEIEFESVPQDLRNKSQQLIQSNPVYKKVPVLLHAGRPLCESLIIVSYLDEQWPSPPLLPSSPYHRAVARFWADFVDKKFLDAVNKVWQCKGPGEEQEQAKKEIREAMGGLEEFLGEKDYFGGEGFGFVDVALIPFAPWIPSIEPFGGLKLEFPKLTEWMERCLARKSVAETLPSPEKVFEFACNLRKALGIDQ